MSKKKNQSITYIYDEMDPSEKVEFERELQHDNNLLIEVESLKKVSEKLNHLQTYEPPAELTDQIFEQVARFKEKNSTFTGRRFFAAAALIVMGLTSGYLLMDNTDNTDNTHPATAATSGASMGTTAIPFEQSFSETSAKELSQPESRKISPWVDENEVIHFYDRFQASESAGIDSLFQNSFQKLTPVTDPSQSKTFQRQLHLTGGNR